MHLDAPAKARIQNASWPGNIRELANVLERAAILIEGDTIRAEDLVLSAAQPQGPAGAPHILSEIEREAIRAALSECDGNRRLAAERLGIGERTLYEKLKRYGLQ